VKLLESDYHTLPYEISPNWYVDNSENRPVAINKYVNIRDPIKKNRFANTLDFAKLDIMLNATCDKLGIEAMHACIEPQ